MACLPCNSSNFRCKYRRGNNKHFGFSLRRENFPEHRSLCRAVGCLLPPLGCPHCAGRGSSPVPGSWGAGTGTRLPWLQGEHRSERAEGDGSRGMSELSPSPQSGDEQCCFGKTSGESLLWDQNCSGAEMEAGRCHHLLWSHP